MQSNLQKQNRGFTPLERSSFNTCGNRGAQRFRTRDSLTGFTLVETLVAITILLLVVIGPITAAQKGIKNAYYASEQLTAVFLAQEAVEAVRELRDAMALVVYKQADTPPNLVDSTDEWDDGLHPSCGGAGCGFDARNGFDNCGDLNGCQLRFDPGTQGQNGGEGYNHDLGVDTPFKREIVIDDFDTNSDGFMEAWNVTVTVSWDSQLFGNRAVTLQTWIYDHYERYEN